MPEAFPPIHLYALLAAAVALMTVSMGRKLYDSDQGRLKRWSPFVPVVLTVLHFILQELQGCPDVHWNLVAHGAILLVLLVIGGRIYADHLNKIAMDCNATLPPLEPEIDGS